MHRYGDIRVPEVDYTPLGSERNNNLKPTENREKEDTGKNNTKEPPNGDNHVDRTPNAVQNLYISLLITLKCIHSITLL